MAENAALAEARRFIAKAALAKNFNAVALRLLSDYEQGLEFPPRLLAGGAALATLKNDHLRSLLAAALSARPRLYIEALSLALPENGRVEAVAAAEALRSAIFEVSEKALAGNASTGAPAISEYESQLASLKAALSAVYALGSAAGDGARILALHYSSADVYGFLSLLMLARPETERAFLLANGIAPGRSYSALGPAFRSIPWPRLELGEEHRQSAALLYSDWLSAYLRKDRAEAQRFALLSAAPGLNEVLATRVTAPHKAALELSFERYWLDAKNALSLDLRADTLLWLRSIGLRPAPDTLSLDVRLVRWPIFVKIFYDIQKLLILVWWFRVWS